jgi:hypothetical protein
MENRDKIIIDLCGGTGAWSRPYREAGYDVRVITLPDFDVMTYSPPPTGVYGILAAPECTMFSKARNGKCKQPRDFRAGMKIVERCLQIIWECRFKQKLAFWAIENPTGFLRQFIGKPVYVFHPFDFGDLWYKRTDLWGYFEIPKKVKLTDEQRMLIDSKKIENMPGGNKLRKKLRSITPPGFANAFFRANR